MKSWIKDNWRTWGAAICVPVAVLIGIYGKTMAQTPVCRPFVYETIQGLPEIGMAVTFVDYEGDHRGVIVAYYWLTCWPGAPVFGLDEVAYVIDYGKYAPAGNRVDVILNRDGFEVVG